MSNVTLNEQHLKDIAWAIRNKCGLSQGSPIVKISKSPNITDKETYGNYDNKLDVIDTVTIEGASTIQVVMDIQTESTNYDWVQIATGTVTSTSSFTGIKYGGTTKTTQTLTFENTDTISFRFRTDTSGNTYYGYWAEVTGLDADGNVITDGIPEVSYRPCDMAAAITAIVVPEGEAESIFGASLENVEVAATMTGGSSNASQIDVDLSPYIGTSDVEPFLLSFAGGTNSNAPTDVGIFYNGSTFEEIFGEAAYSGYGAAQVVSADSCSINKGIVTVKFSRNIIMDAQGLVDILYMKNNGTVAMEDKLLEGEIQSYSNDRITKLGIGAFYNNSFLASINVPNVKKIGEHCFYYCINLNNFDFSNVEEIAGYAFGYSSLKQAICPKVTTITGSRTFGYCGGFAKADFSVLTEIPAQCFYYSRDFGTLILRKTDSITTLANTNALKYSLIEGGTGYIYVPSALIETYKAATNWSTFAAQFRAIEDYPDICG